MFSFLYHCQDIYRTWLYIWVAHWVSYEKQELLTIREHLSSSRSFLWVRVAHLFSFSCCTIMTLCLLRFEVHVVMPVRFPHKNYIQFVFTSMQLFVKGRGSCLIYVICVCLRIVVSNTYCVVFFFVLCCHCLGFFSFYNPSVFSNVYFPLIWD